MVMQRIELIVNQTGNAEIKAQQLEQTQKRLIANEAKFNQMLNAGPVSLEKQVAAMNKLEASALGVARAKAAIARAEEAAAKRAEASAAREARKAAQEARQANMRARGLARGVGGRGPTGRAGMIASGLGMGGAAVPVMMAVGGLMALDKAAQATASYLEIMGNSSMTAAQKNDALVKTLVPFGETFLKLRDAMMNVSDDMRRTQIYHQDQTRKQEVAVERGAATDAFTLKHAEAAAKSTAFAGMGVESFKGDVTSYEGSRAYQRFQMRAPAQLDIAKAQAEVKAAEAKADVAGRQFADRDKERFAAGGRVNTASRELDMVLKEEEKSKERNKPGQDRAAKKLERATKEQLDALERAGQAGKALEEAQIGLAEKRSALRKAEIADAKALAEIHKLDLQQMTQQSQLLGSMTKKDLRKSLNAEKKFEQVGWDKLKDKDKALLRHVNPDKAAALDAARGDALRKQFGAFGIQGDRQGLGKELVKAEARVAVNVALDEQALATDIAKALEKGLERMVKIIEAKLIPKQEQDRAGRIQANNANN